MFNSEVYHIAKTIVEVWDQNIICRISWWNHLLKVSRLEIFSNFCFGEFKAFECMFLHRNSISKCRKNCFSNLILLILWNFEIFEMLGWSKLMNFSPYFTSECKFCALTKIFTTHIYILTKKYIFGYISIQMFMPETILG